MKGTVLSVFIVALIVLFTGCTSYNDEVDPALASVSVRMLATSQSGGDLSAGRTGTRIKADSAFFEQILLGVSKLEFEPMDTTHNDSTNCHHSGHGHHGHGKLSHGGHGNDDNDSTDLEFEGDFVVDLLNGTSTPDFGIAQVVPGVFSEIEIKLSPILPDSNSIIVEGIVLAGNDTFRIEFSSKRQATLKIRSKEGLHLTGSLNSILIELDMDRFLEKINLTSAHADEDGVIRINATTNAAIFAFLHGRLGESLRCGKDNNRDGHVD